MRHHGTKASKARAGCNSLPPSSYPTEEGEDGWGQEEEEGGCPSQSPPPPRRILHVITKCNLVWGAEGFLSTSA